MRYLIALGLLLAVGLALGTPVEPASEQGTPQSVVGANMATPVATPALLPETAAVGFFGAADDEPTTADLSPARSHLATIVPAETPYPYHLYFPYVDKAVPTPTPTSRSTSTVTPTPTMTRTPTPTLTPTPAWTGTATPLPGTEVTVNDDFSDPASGWPIVDRGSYALSYLGGEYRIQVRWPGWTAGASSNVANNFSDFRVGVDARLVSGASSVYLGIPFGIISPDWVPFYACLVGNGFGGFYAIWSSTWITVPNMMPYPTDVNWNDGASRRIELSRSADHADCYVNGNLVASVARLPSEWGEVGVILWNPSTTGYADARFDNFTATGKWAEITPTPTRTPTLTPTPTQTSTITPTPTPTFTPIASQSNQAVAYQINVAHSGVTSSDALNPPLTPVWSADLGWGVSYPLIARGKIFVTTITNTSGFGTRLFALNATTGQIVWGPVAVQEYPYKANAAYDNGRVFVVDFYGVVRAFDGDTGALLWSQTLGEYLIDSPPTASQGIVYVNGTNNGRVYALSARNGTVLWIGGGSRASTPSLSDNAVFVSDVCNVRRVNRWSGSLDWEKHYGCFGGGGSTTVFSDGRLFVRGVSTLPIGAILDAQNGNQLGSFPADYAPAVRGDTVYSVGSGQLAARSIATQTDLWTFVGDGKLTTAPIVVNEVVYAGSSDGNLYGVDANTGQLVWTASLGTPILTPNEFDRTRPLTGLNAGEGLLVVPATNMLVAYAAAPTASPTPTKTGAQTPSSSPTQIRPD